MCWPHRRQWRWGIYVVRAFVRMRQLATTHQDLAKRLDELEQTTERLALSHHTFSRNTRLQLKQLFDAVRELMTPPEPKKRPIGFSQPEEKPSKKRFERVVTDRQSTRK